jgi:hypothetical protein
MNGASHQEFWVFRPIWLALTGYAVRLWRSGGDAALGLSMASHASCVVVGYAGPYFDYLFGSSMQRLSLSYKLSGELLVHSSHRCHIRSTLADPLRATLHSRHSTEHVFPVSELVASERPAVFLLLLHFKGCCDPGQYSDIFCIFFLRFSAYSHEFFVVLVWEKSVML